MGDQVRFVVIGKTLVKAEGENPHGGVRCEAEEIAVPEGVTVIEGGAFADFIRIGRLILPEGVVRINGKKLENYCSIEELVLPSTLERIEGDAFDKVIVRKVVIPDLASWCRIAFENERANPCKREAQLILDGEPLERIVIPEGVQKIGAYAFCCYSAMRELELPRSLRRVGKNAFYGETHLQGVCIEDLTAWCGIAFENEHANPLESAKRLFLNGELLEDLHIPEGVQKIGDYAFYGGERLASVTFPAGLRSVGTDAFFACTAIREVHAPSLSDWFAIAFSDAGNWGSNPTQYAGRLTLAGEALTALEVPASVTTVPPLQFHGCKDLKTVSLHAGVEKVFGSAFADCSALEHLEADPENRVYKAEGECLIDREGTLALGCKNTKIPKGVSVKRIGASAFYGRGPEEIYLRGGVEEIEAHAFHGCKDLVRVVGPSLKAIGEYAFQDCASLVRVVVPAHMERIGRYAFCKCRSLRALAPVAGETMYSEEVSGENAERMKARENGMESVTIPAGIDRIETGLFMESGVCEVSATSPIKGIEAYAFCGCEELASLSLPWDPLMVKIGFMVWSAEGKLRELKLPAHLEFERVCDEFEMSGLSELDVERLTIPIQHVNAYFDLRDARHPVKKLEYLELIGAGDLPNGKFCGITSLRSVTLPARFRPRVAEIFGQSMKKGLFKKRGGIRFRFT